MVFFKTRLLVDSKRFNGILKMYHLASPPLFGTLSPIQDAVQRLS
jgi:hypothetical protein